MRAFCVFTKKKTKQTNKQKKKTKTKNKQTKNKKGKTKNPNSLEVTLVLLCFSVFFSDHSWPMERKGHKDK